MAPKTISLRGDFLRKEAIAAGVITPGHLLEYGGSDDLGVDVHGVPAGMARKAFALEDDHIGNGIDDAYAADDNVQYGVFYPGAEVYAWLAYGETAVIGNFLVSAGDGTLAVEATAEEAYAVGVALEDVTNTTGGVDVRIKVEVL